MTGRHPDLPGAAAQPLRHHRARSRPSGSSKAALKAAIKANPLVTKGIDTAAGLLGRHQLDLRRPLLQRAAGGGAARPQRRPDPFRRGLVRLRPLQPDLPGPPRDARRPQGPQGAHGLRHPFDPQAAGGAFAGLVPAHPRRAQPDPARAVQRVVHDARVDVAALSDHRLERHHRRDDGRPRRTGAHQRVDRGSGGVPADHGPRAPRVRQEERLVLQHLERGPGQGRKTRQEGRASRTPRRELLATDPECLGAASGRQLARVRRPRRRLLHAGPDQGVDRDARAWPTRAASTSGAFRPPW